MIKKIIIKEVDAIKFQKSKIYYHGTDSEEAAHGIIKDKLIKPPEIDPNTNAVHAAEGRVYLTLYIGTAARFAFSTETAPGEKFKLNKYNIGGQFGYIFEVEGKELSDIQPDEDDIGGILSDLYNGTNYTGITSDVPNWAKESLINLAENNLTKSKIDDLKSIDYFLINVFMYGSKLVDEMSDELKLTIIDAGAHIANKGAVKPRAYYKFDKRISEDLKEDYSNIKELSEYILL